MKTGFWVVIAAMLCALSVSFASGGDVVHGHNLTGSVVLYFLSGACIVGEIIAICMAFLFLVKSE